MKILKFGSNCFFNDEGNINHSLLRSKIKEIDDSTFDCAVVASGAIKLGKKLENVTQSNGELTKTELQGYASIGQRALLDYFQMYSRRHVAQILLTLDDMKYESQIRDLIHENLRKNRLIVINYNDSVNFKGIDKDNDTLAAEVAKICNAELLVVFGKYDGFCRQGALIEEVSEVNQACYDLCRGVSRDGRGGFQTKLDAARIMQSFGGRTIVGNVNYCIDDLIQGRVKRTIFL